MIGILKGELVHADRDFFAVNALNQLTKTSTMGTLFCEYNHGNFQLPVETNVLQRIHAFSYDGILITDNLVRCQDLLHATYAKKRFLYCYHLDWPFINDIKFAHIKTVMLNDSIELIARSESHAELIESLFKKPKYIMEEWDYKVLVEIDNNE